MIAALPQIIKLSKEKHSAGCAQVTKDTLTLSSLPHRVNTGRDIALGLQMFFHSPDPWQNSLLHQSVLFHVGFQLSSPLLCGYCFFPLLPLGSHSVSSWGSACPRGKQTLFQTGAGGQTFRSVGAAHWFSQVGDRHHRGAGALGISEAARWEPEQLHWIECLF